MKSSRQLFKLFMIAAVMTGVTASAAAVTASDVDADITEPAADADVQAGGFLGSGVDYSVDLTNSMTSNDTTVDLYVEVTHDGNTVSEWQNETSVLADSTDTVEGTLEAESLDLTENYKDATISVTANFTDDSEGDTATASDSNTFNLKKSQAFATIISFGVLIALFGVFRKEF